MFEFLKSLKKSTSNPPLLAIDLGTELIKVLVFQKNDTGIKILGSGKAPVKNGDMEDGHVINLPGLIMTASIAIREACAQSKQKPKQVIIGMAGELIRGWTQIIEVTRANPEKPVNKSELKNIFYKQLKTDFQKARQLMSAESGSSDLEIESVSHTYIASQIGGQKVSNPIGFAGKKLELELFNVYAPSAHYQSLLSLAETLNLKLKKIVVEPYAVSRSMIRYSDIDSAIYIDVGGGTTDVAVTQAGKLIGLRMFALGGRHFSKRLARSLQISLEEAENLKLAHSRSELTINADQKIQVALKSDIKTWQQGIEIALSEIIEKGSVLPHRIYMCGGGSLLPELQTALEENWKPRLRFADRLEVTHLYPSSIREAIDLSDKLDSPQDVTPITLAQNFFESSESEIEKCLKVVD